MTFRILFATHVPPDPATGVYRTVSRRAEFLRAAGHHVEVLSAADLGGGRWPRINPLLLPITLAARSLREFDAIVFHSYLAWAYELRHGLNTNGKRPASVVSFHGLEPLYHEAVATELARTGEFLSTRFRLLHTTVLPRLLRMACRRADRVVCLNAKERVFLIDREWADPARVSIVPNGVASELLVAPRRHEPVARRLLFTGQWLRAKGTRYLAAAFDRISAEYPETELTCLGTGAGPDVVLRDFAPRHHRRVRVLPRVDSEALSAELSRADVFVLPSLSEGFSGALIEAMASGLPVIATPAGAAPELITTGVSGLLVPFADAEALAEAAIALVPDSARRQSFGAAARRTAHRYDWQTANAHFLAEISRAIAEQR